MYRRTLLVAPMHRMAPVYRGANQLIADYLGRKP